MSSPNVSFSDIPSSIRKPGVYSEFNLNAARQSLPANDVSMLIIAQRLSTGSVAALVPTKVFSDADARLYFGAGSQCHLMVKAALDANPSLDLTVCAVADSGITKATGTIALSGTATSAGVLRACVGNRVAEVAISSGDLAAAIATALNTAVSAIAHELPVTSGVSSATVTLTARNAGTVGNYIPVECSCTAAGITATVTGMASGATDPDLGATSGALDTVFPGNYDIICIPFVDEGNWADLGTHLDEISGPMEQRPAIGVIQMFGEATEITLNHWRITCGYLPRTKSCLFEVAAAYAAVIASESDPAQPLNNRVLTGIAAPDISNRLTRTEIESLLDNGLTPMHVIAGERVAIVRAITTYTENAQGIADPARLDISVPRSLDYVRFSCVSRVSSKFPAPKKTLRFKKDIRSELLDVLLQLESIEIVENMDYWKAYLVIEDDLQDATRVNARIPGAIVKGAHVVAMRIDLL